MLCKKLCAMILVSAMILSTASVTAFADKEEVMEATEEMFLADYPQVEYDSFAEFKAELANGKLKDKLKSKTYQTVLTKKVYTLQKNKQVSKLSFEYRNVSNSKVNKEKIQLDKIYCYPDSVAFVYKNGVSFSYSPNYSFDVNNEKHIYTDAKQTAVESKVINKHRVYVGYDMAKKSNARNRIYTWLEDDCLFQLFVPKKYDINYGFALCKLKKANTFKANLPEIKEPIVREKTVTIGEPVEDIMLEEE